MATAQVTGTLGGFDRGNLADRFPELIFTPSGPTTTIEGGLVLSALPITVTPAADGSFTVGLEEFEAMNFPRFYTLKIQLLDPVAGYVFMDFADWEIYVPLGGGPLMDIVTGPLGGGLIWTIAGGAIPTGSRPGDLLLDTTTSDYYRLG